MSDDVVREQKVEVNTNWNLRLRIWEDTLMHTHLYVLRLFVP